MNLTWENNKKTDSGSDFSKFFFAGFTSTTLLDNKHCYKLSLCAKVQGKLMNQTWKNDKKPSFGTDFFPFGPNLDPKIFSCILPH